MMTYDNTPNDNTSKKRGRKKKYPAAIPGVPAKNMRQAFVVNDGNDDYLGWRAFQTKLLSNDITPRQRGLIIKTSRELVKRDPPSKRSLQIPIEAIENAGYSVQADDKNVESYLNEFLVKFEEKMSLLYMDRLVNGELCLPIQLNTVNGYPYLGYVDPLVIQSVEFSQDDALCPEYVLIRKGLEEQRLQIIKFDKDAEGYSTYEGETFFWSNFPMMGMSRGLPELTAELDYIQLYEKFMRSESARAAESRSFLWQFTHAGKDEVWINNWLSKTFPDGKPPGPAAFFAGNEEFKIQAHAPPLQASDAADAAKMLGGAYFRRARLPRFLFCKRTKY